MHIKQNNTATLPTTASNDRNTLSIGNSHGSSSAAPPPHNQCTTNDRDRDGCMLPGSGIIWKSVFEMVIGKLLTNNWKVSHGYSGEIGLLGEKVFYKIGGMRGKLLSRWEEGVGVSELTGEHLVCDARGARAACTIHRHAPSGRWCGKRIRRSSGALEPLADLCCT